tara:strand:- start:177 stop:449 length:273 start_codon:yes stop_codon:yes gene_type:complete
LALTDPNPYPHLLAEAVHREADNVVVAALDLADLDRVRVRVGARARVGAGVVVRIRVGVGVRVRVRAGVMVRVRVLWIGLTKAPAKPWMP